MRRVRALAALVLLALAACGPVGPIPGGRLSGEVVSAPVDDWSFANAEETLQIETRPEDPYSVNVWFVAQGASLWLAAAGEKPGVWAQAMLADPRVRLRIGGKLYERKAVRVTDPDEIDAIAVLYKTKYDYQRGADDPEAALFRMDPR